MSARDPARSPCLVALGGCDDMSNQPKQKAYSPRVGPAPGSVRHRGISGQTGAGAAGDAGAARSAARSASASTARPAIRSWATATA